MESEGTGPDDPLSGDVAGHYRIERRIGSGGMGEVYLAADTRLRRSVAIKTIRPELDGSGDARRRFAREARMACSVSHPYVATVFDVVEHEGRLLLVMEYLEGRPLSAVLREDRPPLEKLFGWLLEIAEALAAIHAAGLVHRDLKPANVMVLESGHVKVTDFGLARRISTPIVGDDSTTVTDEAALTRTGAMLGTPMYMAPEQLRGETADSLSDQFALGIVAFEAIHGVHPFARGSVAGSVSAILSEPPSTTGGRSAVDDSGPLRSLLSRMLEKRPEDRYPDIESALDDLRAVAGSHAAPSSERWARSTLIGIAATLILLVVAAVVAVSWLRQPPTWDRARYAIAVPPFENLTGGDDGQLHAAMLADLLVKDLQGSYLVRAEGPDEIRLAGLLPSLPLNDAAVRIASTREMDYIVLGKLFKEQGRYHATAEIRPTREGRGDLAPMRATGDDMLELAEQLAAALRRRLPDVSRLTALRDDRVDLRELMSASDEARAAYENGVRALREARIVEAVEALERAVEIDPRFALAFARLSEALDLAGYGRRARDAAERARTLSPEPTSRARERLALTIEATWSRTFGHPESWIEAARALVERFPDEPLLLDGYAAALREIKRFDEALDQLERAVLLDSRNPGLRLSRAGVLTDLSRYEEAMRTLDEAATLFRLVESEEGLARVDTSRGGNLREQESYEAAVASYTLAAERYAAVGRPMSAAESWLDVTAALLEKGDYDLAGERIAVAEEIARKEGNIRVLCSALSSRAVLAYYRRDFDAAIHFYREAVDQARRFESRKLMARPMVGLTGLLVWMRRTEEAIPLLEESEELARDLGKRDMLLASLYNSGELSVHVGDLDTATESFTELVSQAGETPERMVLIGRMSLAWVHYLRGRLADSLEQIDRAVAGSRETDRPMDLGRALQNRARVRAALGRFEQAEADLAEAEPSCAEFPDLAKNQLRIRGTLAFFRGDWTEALESTRKDENDHARLLACGAAVELRRNAEALAACSAVLDSDYSTSSERVEARAWLAQAMLDEKRYDEALDLALEANREAVAFGLPLAHARSAVALAGLPEPVRPQDWEARLSDGLSALRSVREGAPPSDRDAILNRADLDSLHRKFTNEPEPKEG